MNEFKTSHQDFIKAFREKLMSCKQDWDERGLKGYEDEDLGEFLCSVIDLYNSNVEKEVEDLFLQNFLGDAKISNMIGDIMQFSPAYIKRNPWKIEITYNGKVTTSWCFNKNIYKSHTGVYGPMFDLVKSFCDSQLIPHTFEEIFLDKNNENYDRVKSQLLNWCDFQKNRDWTVLYCKIHFLKESFPKLYDAMMKDGNFLSLEEIKENIER